MDQTFKNTCESVPSIQGKSDRQRRRNRTAVYLSWIEGGRTVGVLIHDGVRPLIHEKIITENIQSVKKHGSAITTVTVQETILVVNGNDEILDVPERVNSRLARAPQSFILEDILSAHEHALQEGRYDYIDSCTLMRHYNYPLFLVDGPKENIKITTPEDFYTMRALLDARENTQIYGVEE